MATQAPPARGPEWDWTDVLALCLREARRVLGPTSVADDAAQEAVIRAGGRKTTARTPVRSDPWLAAIARHAALRLLGPRREQPLEETVPPPAAGEPREGIGSPP